MIIAAFDFDGTITYRDSFTEMALFKLGPFHFLLKSLLVIPSLFTFSREKIKVSALKAYFTNSSFEEVAKAFTKERLPSLLRKSALEKIAWHQREGHTLILVTAAFEPAVLPFAKAYGFHAVLATQLDTATLSLIGKNCRGEEKVRRLLAHLGPKENYTLYAYGDSRGDKELLELADYPSLRKF